MRSTRTAIVFLDIRMGVDIRLPIIIIIITAKFRTKLISSMGVSFLLPSVYTKTSRMICVQYVSTPYDPIRDYTLAFIHSHLCFWKRSLHSMLLNHTVFARRTCWLVYCFCAGKRQSLKCMNVCMLSSHLFNLLHMRMSYHTFRVSPLCPFHSIPFPTWAFVQMWSIRSQLVTHCEAH